MPVACVECGLPFGRYQYYKWCDKCREQYKRKYPNYENTPANIERLANLRVEFEERVANFDIDDEQPPEPKVLNPEEQKFHSVLKSRLRYWRAWSSIRGARD